MPRDLIAFEFVEWILRSWRFGVLEVSEGAFCCLKYFFCFFLFLLECVFDARACNLSFLSVERFL